MIYHEDQNGDKFSELAIMANVRFLLFAGHETTKNLIGNMLHYLIDNPAMYERVRNDRSLVPKAIEETLRWEPPIRMLMRTAGEDFEFKGNKISAGERIVLGIVSGNRDEEAYENAQEFSLDRPDDQPEHLGFGRGVHICIGAPLARLEAEICLNTFLNRFPEIKFANKPEKVDSYFQNGYKTLDVVFPVNQ